jgi:predicted  nucleic acid-binding Zn-ribbon protein
MEDNMKKKQSELIQIMDEVISCGETLVKIGDFLTELVSCGNRMIKAANEVKAAFTEDALPPASEVKQIAVKDKVPDAVKEIEKKSYTKEEVRAILADKASSGHRQEVKALLIKHGAEQLKLIDPSEYEALVKEAEEL